MPKEVYYYGANIPGPTSPEYEQVGLGIIPQQMAK